MATRGPYQTFNVGGGGSYQPNDPTSAVLMGAGMTNPGVVPQPPQTGTSTQDSPPGTAASPGILDTLSEIAPYALMGGIGLYGENQAAKQDTATLAPLYAGGQPFVSAGQQLLGRGMAGQLTPLQQQNLTTTEAAGQTLINAATPVGQIASQDFQQYQSGNLKPGDQATLDAQVATAKARLVQTLGPNVDSTTAATYMAQIDNQALQTKQQILNSYFATGNQAFDTWSTTTQAGQKTIIAGQQYAIQQIDQTFQEAFGAFGAGINPIMQAIQLQLGSNEQAASALSSYTANLAKAYALQKAGGIQSALGQVGQAAGALSSAAGGTTAGGGTATDTASQPATGYVWGGGPGGSDYAPGISAPDVTPTYDPTLTSPDWLGNLGGGDSVTLGG